MYCGNTNDDEKVIYNDNICKKCFYDNYQMCDGCGEFRRKRALKKYDGSEFCSSCYKYVMKEVKGEV
jgi:formylmethanofuran dehydrogenase subunit E